MLSVRVLRTLVLLTCGLWAIPAHAQQTGTIHGKVIDSGGAVLPGVTVEARSSVLPTPRVTTTEANGEYRMPALPPGTYTLTFVLSGMQTTTREALVQLGQETLADATLGLQGVTENVTVTATASLVEREAATIKSGVSNQQIMSLPVGQEYRDLVKLIPGVQYTQDTVRGPSAGGSGQDNVYQFDGVNVTLPLFGTLSAEPASHDIAQVTTVKGGARAIDFDRSGGFSIDSVSKSGTSRFSGEITYQFQSPGMSADLPPGVISRYEQDRSWLNANLGGPVVPNLVHFFGSYYRPDNTRDNQANRYGELPQYTRRRNEGFGKLTITPLSSLLFNVSYRGSKRTDRGDTFGTAVAPTTGSGNEAILKIGTADGSWVINSRSLVSFKYTHFVNDTQGRPDNIADVTATTALGTRLNIGSLDTQGAVTVPQLIAGQAAYNDFVQPIINRYGYIDNGVPTGGGTVGYASLFDNNDFFRDAAQFAYNITFGSTLSHDLHFGYQQYVDSEDLVRSSNGWGVITVPGGRLLFNGTPIFYTAAFQQQGLGAVPTIHSEYHSKSIEINDTIRWRDFSFNVGVLASRDTLYGQGLTEDSSTLSGFRLSTGRTPEERKYKMYEIPFSKMIQPRIGATWSYNGRDTIYGSYARYYPAASSLPRAASWDRNLATTIQAHFDANGVLFGSTPLASSSGKLFDDDLTPRTVDEYLLGTARQINSRWTGRVYWRYREGSHFWEDTNNTARVAFNPPPGIPREPYIPDLTQKLAQIGSGSTYVIAELDGAYSKYYEVSFESEYRTSRVFARGSYTWSHYYGNFDQDNSTTANDANVFIGSSFIGDGAGRQLWDLKDGDLRGDRRHMFKAYGYYNLDWNGTVGAFLVAQSGQPWEMWSYEPYIALTTNTSDINRYAEPAGSRRTGAHWQLDLKYIQDFRLANRVTLQLVGDLFNVTNNRTGYNIQNQVHLADFGTAKNFYDPRRFQLSAGLRF